MRNVPDCFQIGGNTVYEIFDHGSNVLGKKRSNRAKIKAGKKSVTRHSTESGLSSTGSFKKNGGWKSMPPFSFIITL
jgi:hypothetical protein